jgi:hypothetical protein
MTEVSGTGPDCLRNSFITFDVGLPFFALYVLRSRDVQMPEQDLSKLSRMIEDALVVAVEMGETTAIYLLSMVSLELAEKIEAAGSTKPDGPDPSMR